MTKFEIILSKLAKLSEENKSQTQSIQRLDKTLLEHTTSSEHFRERCSTNRTAIKFITLGLTILFSALGYLVLK